MFDFETRLKHFKTNCKHRVLNQNNGQTHCFKPKQPNKHATHNTNTMITTPPTECTAPLPSLKQDANTLAIIAERGVRIITIKNKKFIKRKKPMYPMYQFVDKPNPIYIPRKHTVQTYRSQQRKAKRK